MILSLQTFFAAELGGFPNVLEHYLLAVKGLEASAKLINRDGTFAETSTILFWPCILDEKVLADLKDNKPQALLLFLYFTVLWSALEKNFWYLRGWSESIVQHVQGHLEQIPSFKESIVWPCRAIKQLML